MNKPELIVRMFNSLYGVAIGDAINWNSVFHRSFIYPFWTRRLRREIDLDQDKNNIIKTSLPFSLNQQSENFDLSPTDDTEWVSFNMINIISNNGKYDFNYIKNEWIKLSKQKSDIRGSISIISALDNINKHKYPPLSGKDNPHYFDDSAMVRSIPIVLSNFDNLEEIIDNVTKDASITNSNEGIEAACIFAELLFHSLHDNSVENYINSILSKIFSSPWIDSLVKRSLDLFITSECLFDLIPLINNKIVDNSYNYGSGAPINLAAIIALIKYYDNNFDEMVLTANAITKASDSITPLIGTVAGAMSSHSILTSQWKESIKLMKGICLPIFKDFNYLHLVEDFIQKSVIQRGE